MNVGEIMTRYVEFIDGDASAKEAAEMMGELDVGALPVGTPERIEGVVTDRDVLYRVVARGLDPLTTRVRDIASRPVVACLEEDTPQGAMDLMASHHVRRLAVRGAGGMVVGWLTLSDLSRKLLLDSDAMQASLRTLTDPAPASPPAV